jgi:predicted nuclease of predicted toxin-antitoxin system
VRAFEFPLLADENIHPDVVEFLRRKGFDVASVAERGKFSLPDVEVLRQATEEGRVALTHDSDFGGLAIFGAKFIGIIYLRPGHIQPDFTIKTIEAIRKNAPEVMPPFILVAERTGDTVKIRVRQL